MKSPTLLPEFKTAPAVFAIGDTYRITVPVKSDLLFWVTVGEHTYYDHSNGVMRSAVPVHAVTVPMSVLDAAGAYTVHYRKMTARKPYFPESEAEVSATYSFYPVPTDRPVRIYQLADTHGGFEAPAAAAMYFGEAPDLLVLNGDISDHSGDPENFNLIYRLAAAVTGGSRPTVFSRGNHDMRGLFADRLEAYTPTDNGKSYFTFRVGGLWGIVLDAGEDKPDDHDAYGHTNVCHQFRVAQTDFIRDVIATADWEYAAAGVTHRLVVVHHPFTVAQKEPFDIEYDTYTAWAELLAANVKPNALLAGHVHACKMLMEGGELDRAGAIPVIIGSRPVKDEEKRVVSFVGTALTLYPDRIEVAFTNEKHEVLEAHTIPVK